MRKWIIATNKETKSLGAELDEALTSLPSGPEDKGGGEYSEQSLKAIEAIFTEARRLVVKADELCSETESNCPSKVLYEREVASLKKTEVREDSAERVLDVLRPDILPFILAHSVQLKVLLYHCRVSCRFINPRKKRSAEKGSSEAFKDDSAAEIQLTEASIFLKKALNCFGALNRLCSEGGYSKRALQCAEFYASVLYQIYFELRLLRGSTRTGISSKDIRLGCIDEIEGLVRKFPSISRKEFSTLRQVEEEEPFYEKFTEHEKQEVFKAMSTEFGNVETPYGGHWFRCPNGHTYTIGDCSGAIQIATCNECGAKIGGTGHRRLSDNPVDAEFARIASSVSRSRP